MSQLIRLSEAKALVPKLSSLCGGVASFYLPKAVLRPNCQRLLDVTSPTLAETDREGHWLIRFNRGEFDVDAGTVRATLQAQSGPPNPFYPNLTGGEALGLEVLLKESRYWANLRYAQEEFDNQCGFEVEV